MPLNQNLRKNSNVLWTLSLIQDQTPTAQTKSEFLEMATDVIKTETIESLTLCLADNLQRFRLMIQHGITEEEAITECQKLNHQWHNDNKEAVASLKQSKKFSILTWQEFLDWPEKEKTIADIEKLYSENKEFRNDVDTRVRQARDGLKNPKNSNLIEQNALLKKYLIEECAFQKFAASKGFNYEIYKTQQSKAMRRIKSNTDFVPQGLMCEVFFTQFDPKYRNTSEKTNATSFAPVFNRDTTKTSNNAAIIINSPTKSQLQKISEFIEKTLEIIPVEQQANAVDLLIKFATKELIPLCYAENIKTLKI